MTEGGVRITNARQGADALKSARVALGLKQSDVAEKAAMATLSLSNLETGRRNPSLDTFIAWAAAMGAEIQLVHSAATAETLAVARAADGLRSRTLGRLANGEAMGVRLEAHVTRTSMGEVLGCSHTAIAKWEAGLAIPKPDRLLLDYGRLLDRLDSGGALEGTRAFGYDPLGIKLDNLLRRQRGISRETALAMSDEELARIPGLGERAIRRIRESGDWIEPSSHDSGSCGGDDG